MYDLLKHPQISILFYPFSLLSLSFAPLFSFFSIICICQLILWPDPPPYDTFMTPWARPPPLRDVSWYVNGPLEEWAIPDAIEIGGKKARKPLKPEHFKYVSQSSCNCVKKILKKNTVIYLFEFDLKFDNFVWLTHTHRICCLKMTFFGRIRGSLFFEFMKGNKLGI